MWTQIPSVSFFVELWILQVYIEDMEIPHSEILVAIVFYGRVINISF